MTSFSRLLSDHFLLSKVVEVKVSSADGDNAYVSVKGRSEVFMVKKQMLDDLSLKADVVRAFDFQDNQIAWYSRGREGRLAPALVESLLH